MTPASPGNKLQNSGLWGFDISLHCLGFYLQLVAFSVTLSLQSGSKSAF